MAVVSPVEAVAVEAVEAGNMKPLKVIMVALAVVALFLSLFVAGYYFGKNSNNPNTPIDGGVACTEEAKICPDGLAVGRSGPKCEFPDCPDTPPALIPEQ